MCGCYSKPIRSAKRMSSLSSLPFIAELAAERSGYNHAEATTCSLHRANTARTRHWLHAARLLRVVRAAPADLLSHEAFSGNRPAPGKSGWLRAVAQRSG